MRDHVRIKLHLLTNSKVRIWVSLIWIPWNFISMTHRIHASREVVTGSHESGGYAINESNIWYTAGLKACCSQMRFEYTSPGWQYTCNIMHYQILYNTYSLISKLAAASVLTKSISKAVSHFGGGCRGGAIVPHLFFFSFRCLQDSLPSLTPRILLVCHWDYIYNDYQSRRSASQQLRRMYIHNPAKAAMANLKIPFPIIFPSPQFATSRFKTGSCSRNCLIIVTVDSERMYLLIIYSLDYPSARLRRT